MYDPFVEHPIPTAVGLFSLAVMIIILNLTAIVVFLQKRGNKPPVDYPLLSLLIANMLQGTMTLPAYALKKINAFGKFEQAIICDIYRFSFFVCAHASIMSLLVSNVDRLIALFYPLRYLDIVTKARITAVVILAWLFVVCFDTVPFFTPVPAAKCHYTPVKAWSVSMHVVMNIVPLPLLLAGYVVTIRIAYRHARKNVKLGERNLSRREKMKIICGIRATKKVIMIIGCYFLCVGPACVYYLLEWLCMSCFNTDYKLYREQYVHFFLKILVNVYAVISAVIFYWNSKEFRRKAREMLNGGDRSKNVFNGVSESNNHRHHIRSSKKDENWDLDSERSSLCSLEHINTKGNLPIRSRKGANCESGYEQNGSLMKQMFTRKIFAKSKSKGNTENILLSNVN